MYYILKMPLEFWLQSSFIYILHTWIDCAIAGEDEKYNESFRFQAMKT